MLLHLTEQLESNNGLNAIQVTSLSDLIGYTKSDFDDSTIILDLPILFQDPHINVCEIVFMIFTMYRCRHRVPKIVGGVPENCPANWIRDSIKAGVHRLITVGSWADDNENNEILCSSIPIISSKIKARVKPCTREKCEIVLTTRQKQIVHLVCHRGLSNKSISAVLKISESAVKSNITSIMKQYGVRSRTQLVIHIQKYCENSNSYNK